MMNRLVSLFKIPELRVRMLYTLGMLAVYRIGIFVTTPGVDRTATKAYLRAQESSGGGFLSLFNFFSGGALENASIFALGIMPYITSSIIMTMMAVVLPAVERMQKEGEQGRRKINQYTRYGTILISVVQGVMIAQSFKSNGVVNPDWAYAFGGFGFILITVITLTAGTAFIMWVGERITERGIGNGISLIIFAGIVARLPQAIYATFLGVKNQTYQPSEMLLLGLVMLASLAAIVFMEKGQRRIPIQYAKRVVGNRQYGGQATHLPLKINVAGVIPPIFANTVLMFPMTVASFLQTGWLQSVQQWLMPGGWHHETLFVLMIIFFAYFYTAVQFNPVDVADNMRKSGGFIPGIRPGKPTSDFIDFVLSRLTFSGALYLSAVCIMPIATQQLTSNQTPFYFGGTGLLIVVSVALETVQQIDGHFIGKQYEGMTGADVSQGPVRIRARVEESLA
ncbi:MAG: preprotein translocase subunit SecY [Myxococcaceae bacterium]|nr:preprotein translocase subunit SecY [Myxococcaceae bacterium]MBH2005905.1 preprotein translocase subunit SecY [Myxococcaceae bacterium]